MAVVSKFYLHDAATPNTGTMPTGAFIVTGDGTGDATGARTARDANDTIGTAQTSTTITSIANTSGQQWGHRRFVSAPLAAQTFAAADGNWTFSCAGSESNTNHKQQLRLEVYAWRPGSGVRVGTGNAELFEAISAATGQIAYSVSAAWNATPVTILDQDILVFEVSSVFTQTMSTAYTDSFFYDGTTEASTTNCASFVTPPSALTLYTSGTTYTKAGFAKEHG